MNQPIYQLLVSNGFSCSELPIETAFIKSLCKILPKDDSSLYFASAIEETLKAQQSSRMLLAKLCAYIQTLTKMGPTDIGLCLYSADPDLARSVGEISKLVKAGEMLERWPVLEDVGNPDKLAILRRVPNKLKEEVFATGYLPNGAKFRSLSCKQLRAAVNEMIPSLETKRSPELPVQQAKRELIQFANMLSKVSDQLRGVPEFSGASAKLDIWHAELFAIIMQVEGKAKTPIFLRNTDRTFAY